MHIHGIEMVDQFLVLHLVHIVQFLPISPPITAALEQLLDMKLVMDLMIKDRAMTEMEISRIGGATKIAKSSRSAPQN